LPVRAPFSKKKEKKNPNSLKLKLSRQAALSIGLTCQILPFAATNLSIVETLLFLGDFLFIFFDLQERPKSSLVAGRRFV
jgi:hypothetical protein